MRTALELENLLTAYEYTNLNLAEAASSVHAQVVKCKAEEITPLAFIQESETIQNQINSNSALTEFAAELDTFNFAVNGLKAVAQESL